MPSSKEGVLVGADLTQEWLLPWWWHHYKKKNQRPVAFIDFGLSFEMKKWCEQRGVRIPLRILDDFIHTKEEIDPELKNHWEEEFGIHFWQSRPTWFKKPLALLQTPFQKTIWIDLDCEIRCSLDELFSPFPPVAMALDQCEKKGNPLYTMYNSGVTLYQHKAPLILDWAKAALEQNQHFRGDQEIFSHLVFEKKLSLPTIPAEFNWSRTLQEKNGIKIFHLHGMHGKSIIRKEISEWA